VSGCGKPNWMLPVRHDGLTSEELAELRRLRRENKFLLYEYLLGFYPKHERAPDVPEQKIDNDQQPPTGSE
jgi:hypothetical protein